MGASYHINFYFWRLFYHTQFDTFGLIFFATLIPLHVFLLISSFSAWFWGKYMRAFSKFWLQLRPPNRRTLAWIMRSVRTESTQGFEDTQTNESKSEGDWVTQIHPVEAFLNATLKRKVNFVIRQSVRLRPSL